MNVLPLKLYRGVASGSPHHQEALAFGSCSPRGGDDGSGIPMYHTLGRTETSRYTSWSESRSVAEHYARSTPKSQGVILEILFASAVARSNHYIQQGNRFGEDEFLIEGTIRGVRVTRIGSLR